MVSYSTQSRRRLFAKGRLIRWVCTHTVVMVMTSIMMVMMLRRWSDNAMGMYIVTKLVIFNVSSVSMCETVYFERFRVQEYL